MSEASLDADGITSSQRESFEDMLSPLNTTIQDVANKYGLTEKNLRLAYDKHPSMLRSILSRATDHRQRLYTVEDLFRERTNLTDRQWSRFRKHQPTDRWTRKRIRAFFLFLGTQLDLTPQESMKILILEPPLLNFKIESLVQKLDYLRSAGFTGSDLASMVKRWPRIISFGIDTRLKPTVQFLKTLGATRYRRVLIKYPQIVSHSPTDKLRPRLQFLCKLLQIQSSKQLVTLFPPLLWLSEDLIREKVQFLQSALELTDEETKVVIVTYPPILGLSLDNNLKPTIAYLQTVLTQERLQECVLYQPALLAYSLEKRLKPRVQIMKEHGILMEYAPLYLMSSTDKKFEAWLESQMSSWTLME